MLDAGLCTLTYLKSRILPEAAFGDLEHDAAISRLGLAIAVRMENHISRKLARMVAAVDEFNARTLAVCLRRLPVESLSTLQLRVFTGALDTFAGNYTLDKTAGLIGFPTFPGAVTDRVVITYTGGYWLDDQQSTIPVGATALPADLLESFIAEVQAHAEARGMFGAVGFRSRAEGDKSKAITGLSDDMIDALRPYRRFAGE